MSIFTDILNETHDCGWHDLDYLAGREVTERPLFDGEKGIPSFLDETTFYPPSEPRSPLFRESLEVQNTYARVWLRDWSESRGVMPFVSLTVQYDAGSLDAQIERFKETVAGLGLGRAGHMVLPSADWAVSRRGPSALPPARRRSILRYRPPRSL